MNKQILIALTALIATGVFVVFFSYRIYQRNALPPAASGQALLVETALDLYRAEQGVYPAATTNAGFIAALRFEEDPAIDYIPQAAIAHETPLALVEDPPGSKNEFAVDVWGNPLDITIVDGRPRVTSAGLNGIHGDADDITSELARKLDEAEAGSDSPSKKKSGAKETP